MMIVFLFVISTLLKVNIQARSIDQGIITEVKPQEYKYLRITTNDESAITRFDGKIELFNSKIYKTNKLLFDKPQENFYFLPLTQNTFGRLVSQDFLDESMNVLNAGISNIQSQVIIKKQNQKLIDGNNGKKWLSIIFNTYQQFKVMSNQINSRFDINVLIPYIKSSQPSIDIFSLLIDGKKINSFLNQTNNAVKDATLFSQSFNLADFPLQFNDLEIQFLDPFFPSLSITLSSGADYQQIQIVNQFYSAYQLYNSDYSAIILPQIENPIISQLVFSLKSNIFNQCLVKQIGLPQEFISQFPLTNSLVLQTQNSESSSQIFAIDFFNFINGTIFFPQNQTFTGLPSQKPTSNAITNIIISSFLDLNGLDKNLTMALFCSETETANLSVEIVKNEYQFANQTQAAILINNSGTKSIKIEISIPSINIQSKNHFSFPKKLQQINNFQFIQEASLFLQLPRTIICQNTTQESFTVEGFTYSSFVWQNYQIVFNSVSFTSTTLRLTFDNIEIKSKTTEADIFNNSKIIAKCIFNQTFVFYVDSRTTQTVQIIQPPPLQLTQMQINSFNQTKADSLNTLENRTSVQSQLAFSFSILDFQSTCQWVIIQLPLEFTIGFMKMSQFNLQDCSGSQYSYLQGSTQSSLSTIIYTDNNSCIYISCQSLRKASQHNSKTQCLDNIVTISSVKSPDLAYLTLPLKMFIANQNSTINDDAGLPTFFNEDLNLQNQSLPYYFIPNEIFTYPGINITEVDLSTVYFNITSNFYRDVFNFSMVFAYPIYLHDQHQINIKIPIKIMGNQNIQCQPSSFLYCSLKIDTSENSQTIVQIKFLQQIMPDTKIYFSLDQVVANNDPLQNQQSFAFVQLVLSNRIVNTKNITIDILNGIKYYKFISLDETSPLQISNSYLNFANVYYTFNIKSLEIPPEEQNNYYLTLKMDSSIQFNSSSSSCYILTQTTNKESPDSSFNELNLNCQVDSQNNFLIPVSQILFSEKFQLRISGLRNPSGILEQNEQNLAQTYNFSLIWSREQANRVRNVWLIQSVSLPITYKYTCSHNCQGCASNYAACTTCAAGYLKSHHNDHTVLACVATCRPFHVAYNGSCVACQLKDPYCLSCSPSNLTECSSCNQGYTLMPEFNQCLDSRLLKTGRSRLLDDSLSTNLAHNIDTHPDDDNDDDEDEEDYAATTAADDNDAHKSHKAQSFTRMTQESSSAKADQTEGGESSNSGSKVMGQLQDTVGALKGGGAIFIWLVVAAFAVSVSQSVLRYIYNKLKCKTHSKGSGSSDHSTMRRNSNSQSGEVSGFEARNKSGKDHKRVSEKEKELSGQRIDCLMLFLLSLAEVCQMPYTLIWALSVTGGDFESPVLQTLLGACALSTLLWIFDAYQLGSILANTESTPKTSSLLNPLPSSRRTGSLSFVIVPTRLIFCLIPKSLSLTLTNIFPLEGWFRYPFAEDFEGAAILLTNFRKVLSSQIKSNITSLCSFISFLILQYPEVLTSYVQLYDLIIFNFVMTVLCLTNTRNLDKIISILNEIQDNE